MSPIHIRIISFNHSLINPPIWTLSSSISVQISPTSLSPPSLLPFTPKSPFTLSSLPPFHLPKVFSLLLSPCFSNAHCSSFFLDAIDLKRIGRVLADLRSLVDELKRIQSIRDYLGKLIDSTYYSLLGNNWICVIVHWIAKINVYDFSNDFFFGANLGHSLSFRSSRYCFKVRGFGWRS